MSQRGFTLLEMAFVLLIVGLMVGGGLFALAPIIDKTRINQTNATLDQAESALELFVIRNNRLPCPADGSLANTDTNYGLEEPVGGGTCTLNTITMANAVIPWKTLGMDESYSVDGWGTRLSYWSSGMITGTVSTTSGSIMIRSGTTYANGSGPFMTVTDPVSGKAVTPASPSNDQAAYVLVSHGKSGWYGWTKSGTLHQPLITVNFKACNSNPACNTPAIDGGTLTNTFLSGGPIGPFPPSSASYFDDLVRWRSPAFMIQLCGSGSCGNP